MAVFFPNASDTHTQGQAGRQAYAFQEILSHPQVVSANV